MKEISTYNINYLISYCKGLPQDFTDGDDEEFTLRSFVDLAQQEVKEIKEIVENNINTINKVNEILKNSFKKVSEIINNDESDKCLNDLKLCCFELIISNFEARNCLQEYINK